MKNRQKGGAFVWIVSVIFLVITYILLTHTQTGKSVFNRDQIAVATRAVSNQKTSTDRQTSSNSVMIVNSTATAQALINKLGPKSPLSQSLTRMITPDTTKTTNKASVRETVSNKSTTNVLEAPMSSRVSSPISNQPTSPTTTSPDLWPTGVQLIVSNLTSNNPTVIIPGPRCMTTFQADDVEEIEIPDRIADLKRNGGYCGVLATAQSIIDTFLVPAKVWSKDDGKTISQEFLNKVVAGARTVTPDARGTTRKEESAMHENYIDPNYKFICDDIGPAYKPAAQSNKAFCEDLDKKTKPDSGYDCTMGLYNIDEVNVVIKKAHGVRVESSKVDPSNPDACNISVTDTSQQNNPQKKPGTQVWNMDFGAGITNTSSPKGDEAGWNSLGFNYLKVQCCRRVNRD